MSAEIARIPVWVVIGATASGKTKFSIDLAKLINAEIVSADSRYFYRGMDIGTAKPTQEERDGIPHHLIDVADPDEVWSLAVFQQKAHEAILNIHQRGKNVVIVGGTGQYIRALTEGWSPPSLEPDLVLRAVLEQWGNEVGAQALHEKLHRIDPVAAEKIDYQNMRRTIRAFEVIFSTGKLFSAQREVVDSPYQACIIGLSRAREKLFTRIDQRVDTMLAMGLVDEVKGLIAKGYDRKCPAMSAIGYQEICAFLDGECTLDEAILLIKRHTHQYVRRQANWFKPSDPRIHWINMAN